MSTYARIMTYAWRYAWLLLQRPEQMPLTALCRHRIASSLNASNHSTQHALARLHAHTPGVTRVPGGPAQYITQCPRYHTVSWTASCSNTFVAYLYQGSSRASVVPHAHQGARYRDCQTLSSSAEHGPNSCPLAAMGASPPACQTPAPLGTDGNAHPQTHA